MLLFVILPNDMHEHLWRFSKQILLKFRNSAAVFSFYWVLSEWGVDGVMRLLSHGVDMYKRYFCRLSNWTWEPRIIFHLAIISEKSEPCAFFLSNSFRCSAVCRLDVPYYLLCRFVFCYLLCYCKKRSRGLLYQLSILLLSVSAENTISGFSVYLFKSPWCLNPSN
jgi:hypothetical protein